MNNNTDLNNNVQTNIAPTNTPAVTPATAPVASQSAGSTALHLDSVTMLTIIGLLFIVAAIGIVAFNQWSTIGPMAKIALISGPCLMLAVIAAFTSGKERYSSLHEGTLGGALLLLPVSLGTILYQLKVVPAIDSLLFAISALAWLIANATVEFVGRRASLSPLTLFSIYLTLFAWLIYYEFSIEKITWSLFLVTTLVAMLGYNLTKSRAENGSNYTTLGFILAPLILPYALLQTINSPVELSPEMNTIILSLFGPIYLLLAIGLYRLNQQLPSPSFVLAKRILEELAPAIAVLPYLISAIVNPVMSGVAAILGVLTILSLRRVALDSAMPIGAIGVIGGVIILTLEYNRDSLSWPLIIMLVGFALLGIGYIMQKNKRDTQQTDTRGQLYGLGKSPQDIIPHSPGQPAKKFNLVRTILHFIVAIIVIPIILIYGLILIFSYL